MKRRNADCGKLRRPFKRNKITEGIYGSTFVYVKFLLVWALVLMADFILEFRFEYLWPFWLLLRSVYDSFKYQGLAFSVFFVCVAVTSDVVCYLFIPVQWLFFCASTYVWVQYVWHTERGICLPTVSLWLLFVYIEASIRLRDIKSFPFNMDLGRPFAAHCIGYPVVTLGFGFKSYISYRFRLRKQKDVEKENEFYIQLLQQALPAELQNIDKQKALPSKSEESISSTLATTTTTSSPQQNGSVPSSAKQDKKASPATPAASTGSHSNSHKHTDSSSSSTAHNSSSSEKDLSHQHSNGSVSQHSTVSSKSSAKQNNTNVAPSSPTNIEADAEYIYNSLPPPKKRNVEEFTEESLEKERNERNTAKTSYKQQYGGGGGRNQQNSAVSSKLNNHKDTNTATATTANATANHSSSTKKGKNNNTATVYSNNKEEVISRLESDVKKLKADLQISRNTEQELRSHISSHNMEEKSSREELLQLRQDNENLQNKLHNLVTCRQQDKQNLTSMEKKLQEEKKAKAAVEQQLSQEKKAKKDEAAKAQANRGECSDMCKSRRRDLENDLKQVRRESMIWEDQIRKLERETQTLRQYKEAQNESEVLMSALAAMQDKNAHLENSLSAENRLKQDLFSALGEAKRQIEIHQGLLAQKELEIAELKVKIAEVISLVPSAANFSVSASSPANSPLQFSGSFTPTPLSAAAGAPGSFTPPQGSATFTPPPPSPPTEDQEVVANSSLNPNASDYTPKMSQ